MLHIAVEMQLRKNAQINDDEDEFYGLNVLMRCKGG